MQLLLVFIFRLLFMVLCHIFHEQNGGTIDKFNYDKLRSNFFLSFEGKNYEINDECYSILKSIQKSLQKETQITLASGKV